MQGMRKTRAPDEIEAWTMVEIYVKSQLRSPSTADFGSLLKGTYQRPKDNVSIRPEGLHEVRIWVDAQNAFGATIRSHFFVKMRHAECSTLKKACSLNRSFIFQPLGSLVCGCRGQP